MVFGRSFDAGTTTGVGSTASGSSSGTLGNTGAGLGLVLGFAFGLALVVIASQISAAASSMRARFIGFNHILFNSDRALRRLACISFPTSSNHCVASGSHRRSSPKL